MSKSENGFNSIYNKRQINIKDVFYEFRKLYNMKGMDTMKKLRFAVSLLVTAIVCMCGLFGVTAGAYDYPYFIKDGDIKGFRNWEETLDYINRHGNSVTDYTIYIDEDTTVINSMKFPAASKAKSLTFKGVPNNFSTYPDNYDYVNRDARDAVHTINLRGIRTLNTQCDIIFENIMLDSDVSFTLNARKDITFDTNFTARNLKYLKGGSKSTLWVKLPDTLDESGTYYPFDEAGFSTNNFEATISGGKYYITKYTGTSTTVKVPSDANGASTAAVAADAFSGVKNKVEVIAFESGAHYEILNGTCSAYPKLKEVRIGHYVDVQGGAFSNCPELETVTFTRGGYTSYHDRTIRKGAFENAGKLTKLVVPSANIGIEADAFKNCPIEELSIVGGFEKVFAETTGLVNLKSVTYLEGSAPDVEGLGKLIQKYGSQFDEKSIHITDAMYAAMQNDPNWNTYKDVIDAQDASKLDITEIPVVVPTLECNYEVSGFNEVRPDPTIRINAHEKFRVNYLILDNDNALSVYDKKVSLKYLIAANKTGVSLIYNGDFKPVEITGEALCTNSIELVREDNGKKILFDWDSIVLIGKNLVPDDMFYVDPVCLEDNGTIPYLLSKEKNKDVYLRRLAFKLSGKNSDGSDITPIYFSQWKDMITYIEKKTSGSDILITVLSDTNIGQALKMPRRNSYTTITITGGDFERYPHDTEADSYLTYKGYALPDLSVINLPEGQRLSMVDFSEDKYATDHGFIAIDDYNQTIERRAVTFTGNVSLTGDTNLVDIKLNSQTKGKSYYNQFNISLGKYNLMMDKVYSDGYIKDVRISGDLYLAGGNTYDETMRFIGTVSANNIYFFNGYVRADKEINGKNSIQSFNSNLIDIIDTDKQGNDKNFVDKSIDKASVVDIFTKGMIKTKLLNSSYYEGPASTDEVQPSTNMYTTITLNPSKTSTVNTFGRSSAQIYLRFTDNFDNPVKPVAGQTFMKIKDDYLRDQLVFRNYSDTFEVVRANRSLKTGKVGYGFYMIDTSSVNTGNKYYSNYKYAYETLNDAVTDLNRMMSAAEYTIALPRFVRQITKLSRLKAGSHTGTIKLVVDRTLLVKTPENGGYVQDKDYIVGVKKSVMNILGGKPGSTSAEYDWTSDITIDVDSGSTYPALPNPIRIYTE